MNTAWNLSSGPHIRDSWTTGFIMRVVFLSLVPAAAVGVAVNGLHALLVIVLAVLSSVASELVFDKLLKKPDTWLDGSAAVTGLMLALTLSPSTPLYAPVLGSVFAIIVVKCCFGGLGKNFVNPALAARCFLLISFGRSMTVYQVDGVTAATPMAELAAGRAVDITKMFLGTAGGVIGSCALALLIGGLFLWSMDFIHGQICFSVLISFTVFMGLFGGQGFDPRFLLAHLFGGGVILGAFFMATDYVTSPVSRLGQTIYGVLIGVLGAMFRIFGSSPDSFSYSVIIGNLCVPLIDTYIVSKPFAFRKAAIRAQNGEERKPLLKRIPKPVIALTLIALLSGIALSGVYALTKDTIDEKRREASSAAYRAVVPNAESFEYADTSELAGQVYGTDYGRVYINEAVIGKDASGNVAGYAVSVTTAEGNDGDITLCIGVDADGTVNGIAFTELNETPGMGMRCGEPAFMDQFAGKNVTAFKLLKGGGAVSDHEIDAISGATVTSSAVVNAVNAGLDYCSSVLRGE